MYCLLGKVGECHGEYVCSTKEGRISADNTRLSTDKTN